MTSRVQIASPSRYKKLLKRFYFKWKIHFFTMIFSASVAMIFRLKLFIGKIWKSEKIPENFSNIQISISYYGIFSDISKTFFLSEIPRMSNFGWRSLKIFRSRIVIGNRQEFFSMGFVITQCFEIFNEIFMLSCSTLLSLVSSIISEILAQFVSMLLNFLRFYFCSKNLGRKEMLETNLTICNGTYRKISFS